MTLFYLFGMLTLISLGLNVWQWLAAQRFPLHQPVPPAKYLPPVTLLKPLHGYDAHTWTCLRSWLVQDYSAPVQILFGVKDADDPVCEVVRRLIAAFPERDARLVICPETLGPNPKVSTLMQLEPLIGAANGRATLLSPSLGDRNVAAPAHAVVISDADVEAPPHYLTEAMTILQREGVGLVNSFYRFANPQNRAMWLEAIAVNCDFWSQVCQSNSIRPMKFALGAAMGLRVDTLKQTGGFKALVDYIADDNRLGRLVSDAGQRVVLTNVVVDCYHAPMNFRQVWDHQARWARTIRACEPVPYFFSVLTYTSLWATSFFIAWQWTGAGERLWSLWLFFLAIGVQGAFASDNWRRLTLTKFPRKHGAVSLGFVSWLLAFLGNTITWRGQQHRILKGGRLATIDRQLRSLDRL